MEIKKGSKVKIKYKGSLADGTIFDTNENREPLEFEIGSGMIIPGLEEGILGMKKGEKKKLTIAPEKGYGERKEELVKAFPKSSFPPNVELKPGTRFALKAPDGKPFLAEVKEVKDTEVVLDLNHPLAGKDLTFEIEIIDVEECKECVEHKPHEHEDKPVKEKKPEVKS